MSGCASKEGLIVCHVEQYECWNDDPKHCWCSRDRPDVLESRRELCIACVACGI